MWIATLFNTVIPAIANVTPSTLLLIAASLYIGAAVPRVFSITAAALLALIATGKSAVDPRTVEEALIVIYMSLMAQVRRYTRCATVGCVFFVATTAILVYCYWMQAHMRLVYNSRVDIETPKKAAATDKWRAICDRASVPMCDDMRNGTIVSTVCLMDNGASAWVSTPGQREAVIEDCALLRRNATLDIEHTALGEAFNELCAHAPLLNWLCEGCVYRDRSAAKSSWIWSLGQWAITSWSNTSAFMFVLAASMLSSFAPLFACCMRFSTRNDLERLVKETRFGAVSGETPGGSAPMEGMRVDGVYPTTSLWDTAEGYGMRKKES